ncbi:MAG: hypothetical protein Q7U33_04465 [Methylotenera sp.]|jgi:hypothetical protein|uniref:hypothetical protein n=1 Tax=Methylotenera sp. TaxID=2051956 RepID=UPI0027191497|nr:hypothetical protein [Methylotenera sp.]MDO9150614.1 hypothetical protein [Methylotenera sp.]
MWLIVGLLKSAQPTATKATLEYDKFAQKRRVKKEAEAEKDYLSQLTDAAKLGDKNTQ